MKSILLALCIVLAGHATVFASQEDDATVCADAEDNDFDDKTDCRDETCGSSSETCSLLDGPIVVGTGAERALVRFDVPMRTDNSPVVPPPGLAIVDVDGGGSRRDDILLGRAASVGVHLNVVRAGFASITEVTDSSSPTLAGFAPIAGGDWSGDGLADLVTVNTNSLQRFVGNGLGAFTPSLALINPTGPGPENGLPLIVGRSVVVANTRLRIYDTRCTVAPVGFPTNEIFGGTGIHLCSSIDLPGVSLARRVIAFTRSTGQTYLAVVTDSATVTIIQIVVSGGSVKAVQRGTSFVAGGFINDLAFTPLGDVLVFGLQSFGSLGGSLQVRAVTSGGLLQVVTLLGEIQLKAGPSAPGVYRLAIGEMTTGVPSVVAIEEKSSALYVQPFSVAGWNRGGLEIDRFDRPNNPRRADRLVLGQFNDDNLLDVALLDRADGNIILLRQQPAPCATFIASASHGLMPFASLRDLPVLDQFGNKTYTPLSRFNHLLATEVEKANALRRPADGFRDSPGDAAQCPVRFIDVRGHWEKLSGNGTGWVYGARVAWLLSMDVPAPSCWFPLPAMLAVTPLDYWAEAIFLIVPNTVPTAEALCVADLAFPSDPNTRLRFLVAGLGYGLEVGGRGVTSQASVEASDLLNERLREAITDADSQMDVCLGQIFVDIDAHSRGGAVNTHALRRGFGNRGNYNFEISTTLLDAVDPSGGDYPRPWIRGGYIMGDPLIKRVGSEWNSSFYGSDSSGTAIDPLVALTPPNFPPLFWLPAFGPFPSGAEVDEFRRSVVVGLPLGRDREAELSRATRTFGAYDGPLTRMRHPDFLGDPVTDLLGNPISAGRGILWVDPDDATSNNLTVSSPEAAADSASFTFLATSHLGMLLTTPPTGTDPALFGPRMEFDSVGFRSSSTTDATDEARCLPAQCGATPGGCSGAITDARANAQRRVDPDGLVTRELVNDFDFRIVGGIVRNAREILVIDPSLKTVFPGGPMYDGMIDFVKTTATQRWADGGSWQRSGAVTLVSSTATIDASLRPLVSRPDVNLSGVDTQAEAEAARSAWQTEVFGSATTASAQADSINGLSAAAARLSPASNDIVSVGMGAAANAGLWARLRPASTASNSFLVRIEYRLRSSASTASIGAQLRGPNLLATARWNATSGAGLRVAEMTATRTAGVGGGVDTIAIIGRDVDVYSVSVRSGLPLRKDGSDWEFVLLDHGIAQPIARRLANRSFYNGRRGRLARITATSTADSIVSGLAPDTLGWVDGTSPSGAAGTFTRSFSDNSAVASSLFRKGTSFTEPRPRGAGAFLWPVTAGGRLGHAVPGVTWANKRIGFWIEYPVTVPLAAAAAAGSSAAFDVSSDEVDEEVDAAAEVPASAGLPVCEGTDSTCRQGLVWDNADTVVVGRRRTGKFSGK